jgi:NAD(P)-dependent dehydrogenase (short-subunit alcohol dehydrogenase family)
MASEIPKGRAGTPRDIGNLAAFLVSDEADYITGQSISCDGGWIMY